MKTKLFKDIKTGDTIYLTSINDITDEYSDIEEYVEELKIEHVHSAGNNLIRIKTSDEGEDIVSLIFYLPEDESSVILSRHQIFTTKDELIDYVETELYNRF
jgi:hypothetical protein